MRTIFLMLSALFYMGTMASAQTSVVKAGNVVPVSERLPGHEADTYRFGIAYKSLRGTTAGQCAAACNNDQNCAAWTLVPATFQMGPRCELKRNIGAQEYRPGAVSGVAKRYHPRTQVPEKAPAPALRGAPAVSAPPVPRPKPTTLPKPTPKPVVPPKPSPKPAVVPVSPTKPTVAPKPSPKPILRPAVRSQPPIKVTPTPAPRVQQAPTRLTRPVQPIMRPESQSSQGLESRSVKVYPSPRPAPVKTPASRPAPASLPITRQPQPPVHVAPAPAPTPRLQPVPTRPMQPVLRTQPQPSQGLEGGPVKVYPAPRPAPVTTSVSRPAPLPITRQPQPSPRPVAPKPAPQPQRPKQFEMQPSGPPTPQPVPKPTPEVPQPEPITIGPDVTSGGVATDPPAPISQRKRVPWHERTGNEPSYSVGDTDYVPGDEQATAGFMGGAPEDE